MKYAQTHKPAFLLDFSKLNKNTQKRVVNAAKELEQCPNKPRGDTIKKLRMHNRLWRYRLGDHRLIYAVYPHRKLVQFLAIGHRKEIYKRFHYHPDEPEFADYSRILEQALNPDEATPPEWAQYLKPQEDEHAPQPVYLTHQLTAESLHAWGVPEEHHHYFLQCETEEELLACGAPDNYIYAVLDAITTPSIEEIAQEPNLVLQDPDDLVRYAEGDLIDFLLLLDEKQESYVDWALRGPTLVKGGPGSGKSTVALYRARTLLEHAQENGKPAPSILFTTYTNALTKASEQLLERLLGDRAANVEVSTLDKLAMRIVREHDGYQNMARASDQQAALNSAKAHFSFSEGNALEQMMLENAIKNIREEYLLEEFNWIIEGRGLTKKQAYFDEDRAGRGYAFNPSMRKAVWNIYQYYRHALEENGKTSWGNLRSRALELVQRDRWTQTWDYVIVDEAQDLTPTALALCMELANDPAGVFLTADASQSLYNRGFAWKNVHKSLNVVGRTRILRRNYRTTRQIVEGAASLIRDTGAGDEEVLNQEYVHVGSKPVLYYAENTADQTRWIAENIRQAARELRLPPNAAAILTPANWQAEEIAQELTAIGLTTKHVKGRDLELETKYIKAMTIHSAKGLEFPIVVMPYFEEGAMPRKLEDERASDYEKHLAEQRRIAFVGMTRAMRRLYVTYREGYASPFIHDLNTALWKVE